MLVALTIFALLVAAWGSPSLLRSMLRRLEALTGAAHAVERAEARGGAASDATRTPA